MRYDKHRGKQGGQQGSGQQNSGQRSHRPDAGTGGNQQNTARAGVAQASTSMPPIGPQSLQQQRAQFALKRVQLAVDQAEAGTISGKEFKSYAASMPAMIQMNGLGQAAAFFYSQGGAHGALYSILSDWLTQSGHPYKGKSLLQGITEQDMHDYRVAQSEALLLLDWVKRFAKALIQD